jgi:cyclopropane fatty-acyl-phospholipid synthase-like methyltransferase
MGQGSSRDTGLTPTGAGPPLDHVRNYWDSAHDAYLTHVGTTFQAGRITLGESMRESNLWLARAAGLRPGLRVLDAGCGVCGPSIDIAREIGDLRIVGITLSPRQTATATALIREAQLSDRIHVVAGDYHVLPFADRVFDTVFFLESIGYASSLTPLFTSVYRVLRPGGSLYVKDVFRRERLWSDQEAEELAEFDRVYAQRTPTVKECVEAATSAGFTTVSTRDLSGLVSTAHARRAMFDKASDTMQSCFGRLHHRRYSCLPVYFSELIARTPPV